MSKPESPDHYQRGAIEVIDCMRAILTPEEMRGYYRGQVLKYASRAGHKKGNPTAQDLRKAMVYIQWWIDHEEHGA